MEKKIFDVAIIGGGPSGYSAGLYSSRNGLSTVVVEKLSAGGQMATTGNVENYPGFEDGVDGFDLGDKMRKGAEKFGTETIYATVSSVDFDGKIKSLQTSEGEILAKTVIVATGAYPRELGLKDEKNLRNHGVAYCATCDGMMYRGKTVVVVGGGNSAVEDALYLSKICKKVYLVHRRNTFRALQIYVDALEDSSVELVLNSKIEEILQNERVVGVIVKNSQTGESRKIDCQGIFVAVGRIPDTEIFKNHLELDEGGYIIADETTRTSVAGVFVAGDARTKPFRQIVTAVADGATATKFAEEYLLTLK